MPTGYTSKIAEGISFNDFVLQCARAMGALIMMRDEPTDAAIPKFEPSDYHIKAIASAKEEIELWQNMSLEDAANHAQEDFNAASLHQTEMMQKNDAIRLKYEAMLEKVSAWQQPTPEHIGLKKFMTEQIISSIDHACDNSYYLNNPPLLKSADSWIATKKTTAQKNLEYHIKEHDADVERTNGRNDWVTALVDSLK